MQQRGYPLLHAQYNKTFKTSDRRFFYWKRLQIRRTIHMSDMMKAVKIEGSKKLAVVDSPVPQADGTKVVIKITTVGICGSDLHIWDNGDRVGLIMGHEFCGTVVDPGSREDLKVGDRVTALPLNPCGECPICKDPRFHTCMNSLKNGSPGVTSAGAYAEYFASRPDMVRKLSDTISDVEAAMIEPAAGTLHAVNLAQVKTGEKVLVIGGGVIGMLTAVLTARHRLKASMPVSWRYVPGARWYSWE